MVKDLLGRLFIKMQKKGTGAADSGTGPYGESIAARFLEQKGYSIIDRNYRKRYGEIDIVAEEGEDIVFVEVKTRKSNRFGNPFEAVDRRKQQKLSKVAMAYLNSNKLNNRCARFDVVAVQITDGTDADIELIQNAFELCYE